MGEATGRFRGKDRDLPSEGVLNWSDLLPETMPRKSADAPRGRGSKSRASHRGGRGGHRGGAGRILDSDRPASAIDDVPLREAGSDEEQGVCPLS